VKARDGNLLSENDSGCPASPSNFGLPGMQEMFPGIEPLQSVIPGAAA